MAEVSVERAFVIELGHHCAQVAEIAAESFRGDRGIFPAFPLQWFARHMRSDAQARLADFEYSLCLLLVSVQMHIRNAGAATQGLHESASLGLGLCCCFSAESHEQPASAFGHHRQSFSVYSFAPVLT